jgi:hypothetical protein
VRGGGVGLCRLLYRSSRDLLCSSSL